MPINTTLDKTRRDLERTLADVDKTPLYAVVGVTDLAVEKIRVARAELRSRVSHLDAKAFRDQAQTTVAQRIAAVQSDVTAVPEQAKALPVRAQAALGEAMGTALTAYGDLAGRGKTLVNRVRRQQSTADLTDHIKSTAARAKATNTTVKKQTAGTKSSASAATTTASHSATQTTTAAKKSVSRAKSSAKATTTSAKKTATAAKKATSVTASKVGD